MKRIEKRVHKSHDVYSREKRSEIMRAIKSKNTNFEMSVFELLKLKGIKFKTHHSQALGVPDIAIPAERKAVFIDSDFWHGWRYPQWAASLTSDFWRHKISSNRKRDRLVTRKLRSQGWKVLRIWEHQLNNDKMKTIDKIERFLS